LPLALQPKLLRVLETRSFRRVGGSREIQVDVRFVAATHRKLPEMVKAGTFREDLYYRLNVGAIEVPPLRERREDIPGLIRYFLFLTDRE
jgi:transcriptional regulator with PAS, ATPase and Fis domain